MGLGFQITSDKIGPQFTTSATANYAYRLQLNADDTQRLSFGIGLGVAQYSLKGQMIRTSEQGDQALADGSDNRIVPDVRFGVYYNSDFWYLGLSLMDAFSGSKVNNTVPSGSFNIVRSRHQERWILSVKTAFKPGFIGVYRYETGMKQVENTYKTPVFT